MRKYASIVLVLLLGAMIITYFILNELLKTQVITKKLHKKFKISLICWYAFVSVTIGYGISYVLPNFEIKTDELFNFYLFILCVFPTFLHLAIVIKWSMSLKSKTLLKMMLIILFTLTIVLMIYVWLHLFQKSRGINDLQKPEGYTPSKNDLAQFQQNKSLNKPISGEAVVSSGKLGSKNPISGETEVPTTTTSGEVGSKKPIEEVPSTTTSGKQGSNKPITEVPTSTTFGKQGSKNPIAEVPTSTTTTSGEEGSKKPISGETPTSGKQGSKNPVRQENLKKLEEERKKIEEEKAFLEQWADSENYRSALANAIKANINKKTIGYLKDFFEDDKNKPAFDNFKNAYISATNQKVNTSEIETAESFINVFQNRPPSSEKFAQDLAKQLWLNSAAWKTALEMIQAKAKA